jgi:hypothetical protein
VLRAPIPRRGSRDDLLRARLILAEPRVWPPRPGACPLCDLAEPPPSPASRFRGVPAHQTCVARAFPPPPPLSDLGVRDGGVVPRGWSHVANIDAVTDGAAHAHTRGGYRRGDIRAGTVLLIAHRFGEVVEAVVFKGCPVGEGSSFQIPLVSGFTLSQGEWGMVCVRRLR